jgi:hypothetical protein
VKRLESHKRKSKHDQRRYAYFVVGYSPTASGEKLVDYLNDRSDTNFIYRYSGSNKEDGLKKRTLLELRSLTLMYRID